MAENDATTGLAAQIENQIDHLHDVDALLLAIQRLASNPSENTAHAACRLASIAASMVNGVLSVLDTATTNAQ